ncbi:YggT family protein [Lentibacillus saliphilus]|uniref:YggT family protein n=1 Tax=Lentibacillus saliphilus TaxID=2737028 RepID=UPI001C306B5C|nr:YggT family protein [Lentibacillus saliphilus]
MFLLDTIFSLLDTAMGLYSFAIIIYVFMSWIPGSRETSIGVFFAKIVEPYMEIFRKFIPPLGMIDLSPIVAIFVLVLARQGLHNLSYMFVVVM